MTDHAHSSASRPAVLLASSFWLPQGHAWRRFPLVGLVLAALGLGASLAGGLASPAMRSQLWHSWLVGALFALSIGLGGLFFVLVHHSTQSGWGVVVRRIGENAMATLPWMALLFVPLIFGLGDLFPWSHADAVAKDPLLLHKQPYLNPTFFLIRTVVYFAIWSFLAIRLGALSRLQDKTGDHDLTRRMRRMSAPGLILFALSVTFFSFDWVMSLDPHWYSTIFGVYFFAGSVMAFFAFMTLIAIGQQTLLPRVVNEEHLHDITKLMFAFLVFWAYMAFSQFMLIWYANLPEETGFFAQRLAGSWRPVSIALTLGHFIVPFFFLLPRTIKRSPKASAIAALWLLVMHAIDMYWLVMPSLHVGSITLSWLDVAALVGCTGVFLAAFGSSLGRQALVPLRDPRLPESMTFENQ
ncbi:MAG: quinol:cytochrome C oxidoreductase [Acidobacteriota bacterium]